MPKYNIFKEMYKELPLRYKIKCHIGTFWILLKLRADNLKCDIIQKYKEIGCKHTYWPTVNYCDIMFDAKCSKCGKLK